MIKKILTLLTPKQKVKVLLLFLISIFENIIEITAVAMVPIIFLVLQGNDVFFNFVNDKNIFFMSSFLSVLSYKEVVNYVCVAAIFLFVSRLCIKLLFNFYLLKFVGDSTSFKINNILSIFFSLPFSTTSKYKISDIQLVLENLELCFRTMSGLITVAKESVILIFLLIFIFFQSPYAVLTIVVTGTMCIFLFKFFFQNKAFKLGKSVKKARITFIDNIKESILGLKEIIIFDKINYILEDFKENNKFLYKTKLKYEFLNSIGRPIIEFLGLTLIVFSLVFINNYTETSLTVFATFLALLTICFLRTMPAVTLISSSILSLKNVAGLSEQTFQNMRVFNETYESQNDKGEWKEISMGRKGSQKANVQKEREIQVRNALDSQAWLTLESLAV